MHSTTLARRPLGLGFAGLLLSGCVPARAQRGVVGGVIVPDFADLSEQVLPSVVNIAVTGEQRSEVPIPPELRGTPFERQFRERFRGRRQETVGAGSGFVIDPSGFVVTNNHVVGNSSRVVVSLQDGSEHTARVVGTDELTDLALLRIETGRSLPSVPWGSSARARVGSWVLAAGNPFGLGGSVTTGIISAAGGRSAPGRSTTSSRRTPPSTPATPAGRCSTWRAR
jgi:serine protease Do